mmetsp:Transcript_8409/g.9600  ORF Transcript_8409/g.9600 Transcript_8409/m.9600 type:complete len:149 (+) Transcript_8409:107-553(+)|eukprot:CAMPEP_0184039942 /NCGR_PEP_ID=MMETSP0955-20130417/55257_1 /TAXON_ID=627963 /ORGANISM="Aplanochytrium sp, Strain PBS07" /LENGTH=148 /DNA_ID=CAMNT_0026329445 /DNA_START=112 /DNA_END=558 /DNA_ORIENTATION=+
MFRSAPRLVRQAGAVQRRFASSAPNKKEPSGLLESLIAADQTLAQTKLFHKTNLACMVLAPLAIVAHPSPLSMPVDLALAVVFPLHAHMGMNFIFTDYVPGSPTGPARMALLAVTVLSTVGLLKLAVSEDGITGSLKAVWKEPKKEEK